MSPSRSLRPARRALWAGASLVLVAAAGLTTAALLDRAPVCGDGLVLRDVYELAHRIRPELSDAQIARIAETTGRKLCLPPKLGKSYLARELAAQRDDAVREGMTPQVYREAIERKQAMIEAGATAIVPNADGLWEPYGRGPLVVNDLRYGRVNGLGLVYNSGRVDSMDYDAASNRLFATVGTGGVWLSQAATVEELGEEWTSIGDSLPNQSIGAVAWSPAGGGTLIVGGGEPLYLGGGAYDGLGAFWSDDLGATWNAATGDVPDGILTFQVAVDKANPQIVYLATSKGLFRSTDTGRSFANVRLPVSNDCAGSTSVTDKCFYANVVTDVVVKAPGGSTGIVCAPLVGDTGGCPVVAAVGYQRSNAMTYQNGEVLSPGNGLYRSTTGERDSFTKLAMGNGVSNIGLPPQDRFGRTELDAATGASQNHDYLYAIIQDAQLMAGGVRGIDMPTEAPPGTVPTTTYFNGLYVSPDFGTTWFRAADTAEVANNPNSGSSFVAAQALISPGIQAWYNLWIKVDPTFTSATPGSIGAPMRVMFGLEEVWQNRLNALPQDGVSQSGNNDYKVVGTYFAGESCQFPLGVGGDALCPTRDPDAATGYITTTHPDQHEAIFVPRDNGGVCAFVGNDGGVYRQCIDAGEDFLQSQWGDGANKGFYTLLPYHMAVAKDGTVWFGLQDNGSGKIESRSRRILETIGGDGFFVAVDPDNSQVAYTERPAADLAVTTDGGVTWIDIPPPAAVTENAPFSTPLAMDPLDPKHLLIAGSAIAETVDAPDATWTVVFDMGTNPANDENRVQTALDLHGAAAYVGACGNCNRSVRVDLGFQRWLATNVGGNEPPEKGTTKGWHFAAANGLPQRYITGVEIDADDPNTVYVTLGGYGGAQYLPPGRYLDPNTPEQIGVGNVFKSTDAGQTFTDISGDLPVLPALWITRLGGQLLVGTDIGAFISTDLDGTQWAPLGTTLPAAPVTSLHAHPGNADLILASTFGRSIWCYSISGDPEACDPLPILEAPVQDEPTGVETPDAACGVDEDGDYTLHFDYTPLTVDDPLPDNFVVQEATLFEDIFADDADEALSGGQNALWRVGGGSTTGADGWTSQVNPESGSLAYYVPDTLEQNWTLELKEPVTLGSGGGTLFFDTTQATEPDFDYGSVEVSGDDFTTFTTVSSESGVFIGQRQVDLSAFGGQPIKVRFRMSSDGNTGLTGWYVENIRINTNNFATIETLGASATSHALSAVSGGQRYYRIGATATVGAATVGGPFSNVKCVKVELPGNLLPIANAGADFSVNEGQGAMLSGAASSDPENGVLDYAWTQTGGPAVTLTGADTATPSFTAPAVTGNTPLTFELEVTDDAGQIDIDDVIVTAIDTSGGGTSNLGDNRVGGAVAPWTLFWLGAAALAAAGRRRKK